MLRTTMAGFLWTGATSVEHLIDWLDFRGRNCTNVAVQECCLPRPIYPACLTAILFHCTLSIPQMQGRQSCLMAQSRGAYPMGLRAPSVNSRTSWRTADKNLRQVWILRKADARLSQGPRSLSSKRE